MSILSFSIRDKQMGMWVLKTKISQKEVNTYLKVTIKVKNIFVLVDPEEANTVSSKHHMSRINLSQD